MKTRSCLKSSDFSSHTTSSTSCLILRRSTVGKRLKDLGGRLAKQYQAMFLNVTAMVFTGTMFLGGSYLFFVQLAEYGW